MLSVQPWEQDWGHQSFPNTDSPDQAAGVGQTLEKQKPKNSGPDEAQ